MDIWKILGIASTTDRKLIKRAYATALKSCHPEDNPEGFMELREAYDRALGYLAFKARYGDEFPDEIERFRDPQELGQPVETEENSPITESAVVTNILDHLTNYSDIVIQNTPSENESAGYVDFEEEFKELLEKLNNLLENEETLSDENGWTELLTNPLIHNQYYKPIFCRNLIQEIRNKLRLHLRENHFTPRVVILIANFLQSTSDIGEQCILNNKEVVNISKLLVGTKRFLKQKEDTPQNPKLLLNNLKWLLFSYNGRLRRLTFFFTIIILYPLIFLAITLSNGTATKNDQVDDPIVVVDTEKSSTLGNVPLNFTLVILFFWATSALIIKRLNDAGRSPFNMFLLFIPYINLGLLYILLKKKDLDNQHGVSTKTKINNLKEYRDFVYLKLIRG